MSAAPSQPSFVARRVLPEKTWSCGSGSASATPRAVSAGPEARIRSGSGPGAPEPPTTNPAIWMLDPVPTWERVDMLISRPTLLVAAMDTVAGLLVAEPWPLLATQLYVPAAAAAFSICRMGPLAPATVAPFCSHWYELARLATAFK